MVFNNYSGAIDASTSTFDVVLPVQVLNCRIRARQTRSVANSVFGRSQFLRRRKGCTPAQHRSVCRSSVSLSLSPLLFPAQLRLPFSPLPDSFPLPCAIVPRLPDLPHLIAFTALNACLVKPDRPQQRQRTATMKPAARAVLMSEDLLPHLLSQCDSPTVWLTTTYAHSCADEGVTSYWRCKELVKPGETRLSSRTKNV